MVVSASRFRRIADHVASYALRDIDRDTFLARMPGADFAAAAGVAYQVWRECGCPVWGLDVVPDLVVAAKHQKGPLPSEVRSLAEGLRVASA